MSDSLKVGVPGGPDTGWSIVDERFESCTNSQVVSTVSHVGRFYFSNSSTLLDCKVFDFCSIPGIMVAAHLNSCGTLQ